MLNHRASRTPVSYRIRHQSDSILQHQKYRLKGFRIDSLRVSRSDRCSLSWVWDDTGMPCLNTWTFRRRMALPPVLFFNYRIGCRNGILSDVVKKYLGPLCAEHSKCNCCWWYCAVSLSFGFINYGHKARRSLHYQHLLYNW